MRLNVNYGGFCSIQKINFHENFNDLAHTEYAGAHE